MKLFSEGQVKFYAADAGSEQVSKKLPVFYNPFMEFDRDLTVAITKANGGMSYLDGMCASGIRGLRAIKEAGFSRAIFNDLSPDATKLLKKNLKLNAVEGEIHCLDVNELLRQNKCEKIDVIDLDPFGPFIGAMDSSVRAINRKNGLICVTSTDTAPLCGVSVKTSLRRYGARPLKTPYAKEIGLRILIGASIRAMARYDSTLEPVFSYSGRHYFRLFLRAKRGITAANESVKKINYLQHCYSCGWRDYVDVDRFNDSCPNCSSQLSWAGPLWTGAFADPDFCKTVESENPKVEKLIKTVSAEQEIAVPFYDIHHFSDKADVPSPKTIDAINACSGIPTHFTNCGLRTKEFPSFSALF